MNSPSTPTPQRSTGAPRCQWRHGDERSDKAPRAPVVFTCAWLTLGGGQCDEGLRNIHEDAMNAGKIEVLGLGNSLVDILAYADDAYLQAQEMVKGAMTLIDEDRAEALYAARVDPRVVSGGSAANTIVGVASFGVAAAYIGKVKHDPLGDAFIALMRSNTVHTLFSNTDELLSLYETPHFHEALDALRAENVLGIVTRSEKGCIVVRGDKTWEAPAFPIAKLVDTTGAGDMFAAGFLAGLARGADMTTCGRLGALAAAEIIQHLGARPEAPLNALAKEKGLEF